MNPTSLRTPRLSTGVNGLDPLFGGGLRPGTITVLAGPPGSGKTILAQQMAFHAAAQGLNVLYFQTLSEPTAKTLLYLQDFAYFDARLLESRVTFVDLGNILRAEGLSQIGELIMTHVKEARPSLVIIDSFKIFDDLAKTSEDLRKFGYEVAVNLMAWECTTLLLGEYAPANYQTNPLFSIVDGIVTLSPGDLAGEAQRSLQVVKMRGARHAREAVSFAISSAGIEVFSDRDDGVVVTAAPTGRLKTGIGRFDDLVADGIPAGSSLLVSGGAGTGKTALLLEVICRGAEAEEKGIFFSFGESEESLRATARGFGWDLDAATAAGLVEIVSVAPPDIRVDVQLARIEERIRRSGARRVAIDSLSTLLSHVRESGIVRDKLFQLTRVVREAGAMAFLAADVPYGSAQLSPFGIEESVVDGIVLLSSVERGLDRQRFIEIYKLRNTAHLKGRHNMTIGRGGMSIFPRCGEGSLVTPSPATPGTTRRLGIGVPGLDRLLGGGVLERSVTMVSGSTGIGKSTLGMHFSLAGAERGERTLFIAREEGPGQILASATVLGLPLREAVERGLVEVLFLSREDIRAAQLLTILTDKIRAGDVKRLVLDSATRLETDALDPTELPQLLYSLVVRFKALGVTSLFTLESRNMFATGSVSDQGLSTIADNLLMLRYAEIDGALAHTVSVIKTRGSAHEAGMFAFSIGRGGITVGHRLERGAAEGDAR